MEEISDTITAMKKKGLCWLAKALLKSVWGGGEGLFCGLGGSDRYCFVKSLGRVSTFVWASREIAHE